MLAQRLFAPLTALITLAAAAPARAVDPDPLVRQALDDRGLVYEVTELGHYRLKFDLADGRSQFAFVQSNTRSSGDFQTREIWAPVFSSDQPLSAEAANRLLHENNVCKVGAWQIYIADGKYNVAFVAKLFVDANAEGIHDVLLAVVDIADAGEKDIFGTNSF